MGNFCGKCGNMIDNISGVCPVCNGGPEKKVLAKKTFCGFCGNETDGTTGICSVCGASTNNVEKISLVVKNQKSPKVKTRKSTNTVAIVFSSFLLVFMILLTVVIGSVRTLKESDTIEEVLDRMDLVELIDENFRIQVKERGAMSIQAFLDYYYRDQNIDMTTKKFSRFVEESTIKEFFAEKCEEYIEEILDDESEFSFTQQEFVNLIDENISEFEKIFDVYVSYNTYELYEHFDEVTSGTGKVKNFSTYDFKDNNPVLYYSVKVIFSSVTWIVLIVVCLMLAATIILAGRNKGLSAIAIVSIIIGSIMVLALPVAYLLHMIFDSGIATAIILTALSNGFLLYAGMIVFGILVFVVRKLIFKILEKRKIKMPA